MIVNALPQTRPNDFTKAIPIVKEIMESIKEKDDEALYELTEKFDKVKIKNIKVSKEELIEQSSKLDNTLRNSIDVIYEQLKAFHELTMPPNMGGGNSNVSFGIIWKSIERVGIYVPGDKHSYPSTLLMASVPAKIAGVNEIYVATPANKEGTIDPALAYISLKLGVNEVYRIGGAQAIIALALGTKSVKKVDKIIGPGNIYVQAAKYLVSNIVGIDGIEGPTELVIIADSSAKAEYIVLDMKAQAEHGDDSYIVLLSDSYEIMKKVEESLKDDTKIFYVVKTRDIEEAIELANIIAPEHLSLYVKDPLTIINKIRNSGAISLGSTPPALIDYAAGPNHILPTNGWARFRGGITVYDFLKPIMYAYAQNIDKRLVDASIVLANHEGFVIHGKSIGVRYE
ncbi:MAG: histidinol dehydrogenase [Saccharolobus sp.]